MKFILTIIQYLKTNIRMIKQIQKLTEHIEKKLGTILYKKMIWENML